MYSLAYDASSFQVSGGGDVVTFDGVLKQIRVNPGISAISVKTDIYSNWKEWLILSDNSKFPQALRVIGGDPIGGGKFAGDLYFLMNDWQVVIDHEVLVDGILFHDSGIDVFLLEPGGAVQSTVSNLVQTVSTAGGDLSQVLLDLTVIKKMIAETQAFVLAS